MKNYKVIKEFASAQKGDMLTYNEDTNLYEFSMTTENDSEKCSRYICMDEETAEEFQLDMKQSGTLVIHGWYNTKDAEDPLVTSNLAYEILGPLNLEED